MGHKGTPEPRTVYIDLGTNYFDERKQDYVQKQLIKRLENMGLKVSFESAVADLLFFKGRIH